MTETEIAALEAVASGMFRGHMALYLMVLPLTAALEVVAIYQFFKWYNRCWTQDRWWIRFVAIWAVVFGLGFTITQFVRTIDIFANHFGTYYILLNQRLGRWLVFFMLGAHMGSEAFYIHRVYLLSGRSKWAMAVFCPLWFYVVGLSVAGVVTWPRWATQFTKTTLTLYTVLGASLAGFDVIITLTILYLLYKRRSQSSDRNSTSRGNRLVRRLMRLSVETQMPVSVFAILLSIADGVHNIYFWITPICLPCLCMASQITLLIWLNARRRIGGPAGGETSYEQEDRGEQQRPPMAELTYEYSTEILSLNKVRAGQPPEQSPSPLSWQVKTEPGSRMLGESVKDAPSHALTVT